MESNPTSKSAIKKREKKWHGKINKHNFFGMILLLVVWYFTVSGYWPRHFLYPIWLHLLLLFPSLPIGVCRYSIISLFFRTLSNSISRSEVPVCTFYVNRHVYFTSGKARGKVLFYEILLWVRLCRWRKSHTGNKSLFTHISESSLRRLPSERQRKSVAVSDPQLNHRWVLEESFKKQSK